LDKVADSTPVHSSATKGTTNAKVIPAAAATPTSSTKGKSKSKAVTISSPVISGTSIIPESNLPTINSSYELERELKLASGDSVLLGRIFKVVKISQLKSLLANLMEPLVLFHLLIGVARYFGTKKGQWSKVCKWFAAVGAVKRFESQYALLGEEYKLELRAVVTQLQNADLSGAVTSAADTTQYETNTNDNNGAKSPGTKEDAKDCASDMTAKLSYVVNLY
jgi:hypothetical protein